MRKPQRKMWLVMVITVAVSALVVAALVGFALAGRSSASSAVKPDMPPGLKAKALEMAVVCSDPQPTQIDWSLATVADLIRLTDGDSVDAAAACPHPEEPRYIVVLHGSFEYRQARVSPGSEPPKGEQVVLGIDPATMEVTSLAIGGTWDASTLPQVQSTTATQPDTQPTPASE